MAHNNYTLSYHDSASALQGDAWHTEYEERECAASEAGSMSSASYPPFSAPPSTLSSYTSYEQDPSDRSPSPTSSVISITDSLRTRMYKEEFGRGLNNHSEIYRLPADEEEWDRLEKQHQMFIEVMKGKYPAPMTEIMTRHGPEDYQKACLDLGCGNGSWIRDVALDFPDCEAVAVDLVPFADTTSMPPNLRSEIDDINFGLEHFYDSFDVVHSRLISSGIKDYQLLIEHVSAVLRPGGLIDVAEFDFHMYDRNHSRINLSCNEIAPPWWGRWMAYLSSAIRISGGDADAATHLYTWIDAHPAFENVVYREFWLPVVPGSEQDFHDPVNSRLKDDVLAFLKSGRPLLLGSGMAEADVDCLQENAIRELHESRDPQYTRVQCVYATKKWDYEGCGTIGVAPTVVMSARRQMDELGSGCAYEIQIRES